MSADGGQTWEKNWVMRFTPKKLRMDHTDVTTSNSPVAKSFT